MYVLDTFRRSTEHLPGYFRTMRSILIDTFSRYRVQIAVIVLTGIAGLGFQLGGIAQAMLYARALERGGPQDLSVFG